MCYNITNSKRGVGYMRNIDDERCEAVIKEAEKELQETPEGKYYKRIVAVYMSFIGISRNEVCRIFKIEMPALNNWIRKAANYGIASLCAIKQSGRPPKLSFEQKKEIDIALNQTPKDFGYEENIWEGKILSDYIYKKHGVILKTRACQMLIKELGYTLQRPRTMPLGGDEALRESFKKQ